MALTLTRRGRTYYIRGTVQGCRIYESTRVHDRRTAELIRARREAEILERATFGTAATLTFAEAALTYIETGGEARFLAPLLTYFGPDARVRDIDNAAVNRCAAALYPNAAAATVNRQVITPISAVLRLAAQDGYCAPRSFRRRREPKGRVRWLTPAEAERLITAAAALTLPRHTAPEPFTLQKIAFLLGTGCRASECFAAEIKDFNSATGQWYIPGTDPGAGKTRRAARFVRLPARARALIGDLPEIGRAFRTPYGKPITLTPGRGGQMQAAFARARDAAGLGPDVTPHTLRHTWATWFYAQTRDFGALIDLGGWDKADTANRYRKIAPDDLADQLFAFGWDFTARPDPDRSAPVFRSIKGGAA